MIELLAVIVLVALIAGLTSWKPPTKDFCDTAPTRSAQLMTRYYRTQDGIADYQFSFEQQSNGSWRVYILEQPSYEDRPANANGTHRLTDMQGRSYICWTDALITYSDAERVAALWADATQVYIQTGAFPNGEWIQRWKAKF